MKDERRSMCPIAYSLDLFGDRWTLLILRDILLRGARHFHQFRDAGEGIATNILSDRLSRLEAAELIHREPDPADGRRAIYRPSERARLLIPLLLEMVVWGGRNDPDSPVGSDFLRRWDTERAAVVREFEDRLLRDASVAPGPGDSG